MAVALKEKPQKTSVAVKLAIDYPQQDETITSDRYTIRVDAPEAARTVEVSVDQGDWQACRRASGYWWYDWSGYDDGEHVAVARLICGEGRKAKAEPREFFVRRTQPKA
jgi:hypothetical protein